MSSQPIAVLLRGSDRRSIGRSNFVVKLVLRAPKRFAEVIKCLWSDDPVVRMRAAGRSGADRIAVAFGADDPAFAPNAKRKTTHGRRIATLPGRSKLHCADFCSSSFGGYFSKWRGAPSPSQGNPGAKCGSRDCGHESASAQAVEGTEKL